MNLQQHLDRTNPLRRKVKGNLTPAETDALKKRTWRDKFRQSYADIENPTWKDVYDRLSDPVFWGLVAARSAKDVATGIYDLAKPVPYDEFYPGAKEFGFTKLFREQLSPILKEIATAKSYPDFEEGFGQYTHSQHTNMAKTNAAVEALTQKYESEAALKHALANRPNEVLEDIGAVASPPLRAAGLPLAMGALQKINPNHPTRWYHSGRRSVDVERRLPPLYLSGWDYSPDVYYKYSKNKDLQNPEWEGTEVGTSRSMKGILRGMKNPEEGLVHVFYNRPHDGSTEHIAAFEAADLLARPKNDPKTIPREALSPPLTNKTTTERTYKKSLIKHVRETIGEDKIKEWAPVRNELGGIHIDELRNTVQWGILDKSQPDNVSPTLFTISTRLDWILDAYMRDNRLNFSEIELYAVKDKSGPNTISVPLSNVEVIEKWNFNAYDVPRKNVVTGKPTDRAQFENWDADPNVFYRITNTERLDQRESYEIGAAGMMDRVIKKELRNHWKTSRMSGWQTGRTGEDYIPQRDYAEYLDENGELMSLKEIRKKFGSKGTTKEYWYWSEYERLADELFNMKISPPPKDYFFRRPDDRKRLVYSGVNAVETLDDSMKYRKQFNWDSYAAQGGGRPVLQVFEGEYVGETYSSDGAVVIPTKTIGAFDLKTMK